MELYPAVDVQGGRVARAHAGAADPLALALAFSGAGARWIHLVDLDRAYARGANDAVIGAVLRAAPVAVQVGGGLAAEIDVDRAVTWGARRVVIGPKGGADAPLVRRLVARHGASRLAVGIDARHGRVVPRGSDEVLPLSPAELAAGACAQGIRTLIYNDVTRDGTLAGPDLPGARALAALDRDVDVIVSGGIAALDDLRAIRDAGLAGAIVGRALHENRFTLAEALACIA